LISSGKVKTTGQSQITVLDLDSLTELRNIYEENSEIQGINWNAEDPKSFFWITSSGKVILYDLRIRCPQKIQCHDSMKALLSFHSISSSELIVGFGENNLGNMGHFDLRKGDFVQRWNDPHLRTVSHVSALPSYKQEAQPMDGFLAFGELKDASSFSSPSTSSPNKEIFSLYRKSEAGWRSSAGLLTSGLNTGKSRPKLMHDREDANRQSFDSIGIDVDASSRSNTNSRRGPNLVVAVGSYILSAFDV
jgi:hypothetical protein